MLGGSTRPWRVRRFAPETGGTKYQVMFRVRLRPERTSVPRGRFRLLARLTTVQVHSKSIRGFGGLRLGEQNGLRAIDLFFYRGYAQVNGAWVMPRKSPGYRGPVKNNVLHEVPLPRSLLHDELVPRVKELFGLGRRRANQEGDGCRNDGTGSLSRKRNSGPASRHLGSCRFHVASSRSNPSGSLK